MPQPLEFTKAADRLGDDASSCVHVTPFDYSFAVSGGTQVARTISVGHIPAGAFVIGGWYQVSTTFTSGGSATVALHAVGANDLVTAIAIDDASAPYTIDLTKRKPLKRIITQIATSVPVVMTIGTADLTAGVFFGCVEWLPPIRMSSGH